MLTGPPSLLLLRKVIGLSVLSSYGFYDFDATSLHNFFYILDMLFVILDPLKHYRIILILIVPIDLENKLNRS